MPAIRAEVRVTGQVQGVWFRQSAKQTAEHFGVNGWVSNCPDGSVEAVFEGEKNSVQKVVDWCQQGPQLAQVADLQVDWKAATGEFVRFQVR
jgi:acylphosphatase